MDNIAKLVLGTLGFIGFVAVIIPKGNPLQPPPAPAVATVPAQPSVAENAPPPAPAVTTNSVEQAKNPVADNDIPAFGQPMLDPTPPGQKRDNAANEGNGEPGAQVGNLPAYTLPDYSPSTTGIPPQPASGT